jgi:hypothetical protein
LQLKTAKLFVALACCSMGFSSSWMSEQPIAAGPPGPAYPGVCSPWIQVNAPAFGLPGALSATVEAPTQPYQGEEGFEVLVYKDQLYLGMEADNQLGARLWRTRLGVQLPWNQADWEEVTTSSGGLPFGLGDLAEADHIDSLAAFNGQLYVSTAARGNPPAGTRIFRSPNGDPATWEDVLADQGAGFGDAANENFKDMQVFEGWLCGGTWNAATGAQVWCTADGTNWSLKNQPGFTQAANAHENVTVWSGHVFDGALYFGVQNQGLQVDDPADDVARLYRTTSLQGEPVWDLVFEGEPGSNRVDLLGDLAGYLYFAVSSRQGIRIWRSPNGSRGSWIPASQAGLDGNVQNVGTVVDGAVVYNGTLYLGVINAREGAGVWRTSGERNLNGDQVVWEQVGGQGLGDQGNLALELVPFNGQLYAWTSNYARGQGVLRTVCPICQQAAITGPGRYDFSAVGASLDFMADNLESVEVCQYPQAPLPDLKRDNLAAGYYRITPNPASASVSASLTLSTASKPGGSRAEGRLIHWTGQRWAVCSPAQSSEQGPNEVRCPAVDNFSSPWGIIYGAGPLPAASQPSGWLGLVILGLLALFGRRRVDF